MQRRSERQPRCTSPPAFIKNGRPEDFLEQLTAAIEAVRQSVIGHSGKVGTRVGAKAGIAQELKRGRSALTVLDSIVKVAFDGNDVVLAQWHREARAWVAGWRHD